MSIDNTDETEFTERRGELDPLDLRSEDELLVDISEEEDDVSLVSDLFRQISQETPVSQDLESPDDAALVSDLFAQITQQIPSHDLPDLVESDRPSSEEAKVEELSKFDSIKPQKKYLMGIGLAIALAIASLLAVTRFSPRPNPVATVTSTTATKPSQTENFPNLDTPELTRIASQKFADGELNGAATALKMLLDRNALLEARGVISAIPPRQVDTAEISFLRGRAIWQSLEGNNNIVQIQAARKYWQQAVKKNPNSVLYANALGFAYYAEQKYDEAIAVWFEAIDGAESPKSAAIDKSAQKQILNNYAGIALALWRVADTQPSAARKELTQEAIKLASKVLSTSRTEFQPKKLEQDWMWTETAIKDWHSFVKDSQL